MVADVFPELAEWAQPRAATLLYTDAPPRIVRARRAHPHLSAVLGLAPFGRHVHGGDLARYTYRPVAAARSTLLAARAPAGLGAPDAGPAQRLRPARSNPGRSRRGHRPARRL